VGSPIAVGGAWAGGWENNDRGGGEQGAGVVGRPNYGRRRAGGSSRCGRPPGVGLVGWNVRREIVGAVGWWGK
jgi:hypothetical protein